MEREDRKEIIGRINGLKLKRDTMARERQKERDLKIVKIF